MENRLAIIRTIGRSGTVESVVSHNHIGLIREKGECPACDEFHELFAA